MYKKFMKLLKRKKFKKYREKELITLKKEL